MYLFSGTAPFLGPAQHALRVRIGSAGNWLRQLWCCVALPRKPHHIGTGFAIRFLHHQGFGLGFRVHSHLEVGELIASMATACSSDLICFKIALAAQGLQGATPQKSAWKHI